MDTALLGTWVAAGCLAAATAFGLWRRSQDGRLRPVRAAADPGVGVDVSAASVSVGAASAASVSGAASPSAAEPVPADLLAALGVTPGAAVTLLQFSSAFCAPCRVTRRVCAEAAQQLAGVSHVEVDAESHLDAVRALGIWRTPTVLVLDGAGRVVQRATGAPTKAQVVAAIAPLVAA